MRPSITYTPQFCHVCIRKWHKHIESTFFNTFILFFHLRIIIFLCAISKTLLTQHFNWPLLFAYHFVLCLFLQLYAIVSLSHKEQIIFFSVHHHNRIVCPLCWAVDSCYTLCTAHSLTTHIHTFRPHQANTLPLVQEVTKYLMFLTFDCLKCKMTFCCFVSFMFAGFSFPLLSVSHLMCIFHLCCLHAVSWKIIEGNFRYSRCVNRFA